MALNRKSPIVKRDQARLPEIHHLTESKGASYPPGSMLIASPLEIGKVVQKIPSGTVMTLPDLRQSLANKFKADYTCPLTTGIFLRILADAAEEEGSTASCPYWRVVRADGRLIDRSPGGEAAQAKHLEHEGIALRKAGKTGWKVIALDQIRWAHP
jgi:alkylated DNA nucleotide flippase Atl1